MFALDRPKEDLFLLVAAVSPAAPKLKHHVDGRPRRDVVALEGLVVRQLLPAVDELDLVDLDPLLLLEGLLHRQHLVVRLEVQGLLPAGEGLDVNLDQGWLGWVWFGRFTFTVHGRTIRLFDTRFRR
jgi:hypothetical protein